MEVGGEEYYVLWQTLPWPVPPVARRGGRIHDHTAADIKGEQHGYDHLQDRPRWGDDDDPDGLRQPGNNRS